MAVFSVSGVEPSVSRRQTVIYQSIRPKLYLFSPVYLFLKLLEDVVVNTPPPQSFCFECFGEGTLGSVKMSVHLSFCPLLPSFV
jgi:hypothetical protein